MTKVSYSDVINDNARLSEIIYNQKSYIKSLELDTEKVKNAETVIEKLKSAEKSIDELRQINKNLSTRINVLEIELVKRDDIIHSHLNRIEALKDGINKLELHIDELSRKDEKIIEYIQTWDEKDLVPNLSEL